MEWQTRMRPAAIWRSTADQAALRTCDYQKSVQVETSGGATALQLLIQNHGCLGKALTGVQQLQELRPIWRLTRV